MNTKIQYKTLNVLGIQTVVKKGEIYIQTN